MNDRGLSIANQTRLRAIATGSGVKRTVSETCETTGPSNRRNFFRLYFPADEFLLVQIEGLVFEICELAERSFVVTDRRVPHRGGRCCGVIQWSDGRQSRFSGEVGPDLDTGRLIMNVEGIATGHIVFEQRRILKKYPQLKNASQDRSQRGPDVVHD